jgi:hypothetical protein
MSEANVETIRRHYEIRHGEGGKRRKVGRDDWSREHPRQWIALGGSAEVARAHARERFSDAIVGASDMPYKNPDRQRAAQAEHARRMRAAGVEPSRRTLGPLLSGEVRLATAKDVLAVIESQIEAVLDDAELGTAERARTAATLWPQSVPWAP